MRGDRFVAQDGEDPAQPLAVRRKREAAQHSLTQIENGLGLTRADIEDTHEANRLVQNVAICKTIFSHNVYYDNARLRRDVPEFQPQVSLADGLSHVIEAMDSDGRIPNADDLTWEDRLIAAQRNVRNALA